MLPNLSEVFYQYQNLKQTMRATQILMIFLFVWFLYQAWDADPEGWLAPFATGSVGTVLLQIGVVIAILIGLNKWIVKKTMGEESS